MTTFKTINGFGSGAVTKGEMQAPKTNFKGRGGFPEGKLQRYPASAGDITNTNRRLGKTSTGDMGSGTSFCGNTAFSKKR